MTVCHEARGEDELSSEILGATLSNLQATVERALSPKLQGMLRLPPSPQPAQPAQPASPPRSPFQDELAEATAEVALPSVSTTLRRHALKAFLDETCGTVANSFDVMAGLALKSSIGGSGTPEDRLRFMFSEQDSDSGGFSGMPRLRF
ncbi:hypothetical protein AK812_SmicGene1048 [Symbiodinium microadriaticum]|uniref:Uncharacterized protein n=1 Tax=Symbiodinium microadriaticum TaxID=2951 RepID=A0A1Q9F4Y3_SYMMI|nr:hypothetical protein AK812_SmicGene1048 [Symbiodinium microadriaticum]